MLAIYKGSYTFPICHTEPLLLIQVAKHSDCQTVPREVSRYRDTSQVMKAHGLPDFKKSANGGSV